MFKRTVAVWGEQGHAHLGRLRVGLVGLGSVGSIVAEALARMGLTRFVLIDFDEVQPHNLDRILGATRADVGALKVNVAKRSIRLAATAASVDVRAVAASLAEPDGRQPFPTPGTVSSNGRQPPATPGTACLDGRQPLLDPTRGLARWSAAPPGPRRGSA